MGDASRLLMGRFLSQAIIRENGCIEWTGGRFASGYGRIQHNGKIYRAHRLAYQIFVGPLLDGLEPDHTCHTRDAACPGGPACPHRACVNPDHLEPVPHHENVLRGRGHAAGNAVKTQCKNGHPFDGRNTGSRSDAKNGGRRCRRCAVEATQRYYARMGRN